MNIESSFNNTLKCELCEQWFDKFVDYEVEDYKHINLTGACLYCDKNRDNY